MRSLIFCAALLRGFALLASLETAFVAGSVCTSGIYKDLLFLSTYAPAESYCSQHYPLPAKTVTTPASVATSTVTVTTSVTPAAKLKNKRIPKTAKTSSISKTTTSKTSDTNAVASLWSALEAEAASIVSTLCSCIETPTTVTRAGPISTKTTTTTTTVTISPTAYQCSPGPPTTTSSPAGYNFVRGASTCQGNPPGYFHTDSQLSQVVTSCPNSNEDPSCAIAYCLAECDKYTNCVQFFVIQQLESDITEWLCSIDGAQDAVLTQGDSVGDEYLYNRT